jgi:hypothetical protein
MLKNLMIASSLFSIRCKSSFVAAKALKDRAPEMLIGQARIKDINKQLDEAHSQAAKSERDYLKKGRALTDALQLNDQAIESLEKELDPAADQKLEAAENSVKATRAKKSRSSSKSRNLTPLSRRQKAKSSNLTKLRAK